MIEFAVELRQGAFTLDAKWRSEARTLGIFGPSGSGKSSLLESLAGWREKARVYFKVDSLAVEDARIPPERRQLGYVPQDALLWPHRNVIGNLTLGRSHPDLVRRTVEVLGLEDLLERRPVTLSGGERMRVALARAVVQQPQALLLDEPLGALDAGLRRRILPYLVRVSEEFRIPTLLVSHDPVEILALCEEVVLLDSGRVVRGGDPRNLLREVDSTLDGFENVLTGTVTSSQGGTALVELSDGGQICAPAHQADPGKAIFVTIGSDEILVALQKPEQISARNVLSALITALQVQKSGSVRIDARLDSGRGALLSASLTQASAEELGLKPGIVVWLVFKTQSCRVMQT